MNNEKQKNLISVIVPVFKVEKYLKRCVISLINQTYKEIEIILINDGSPDNCPQICDDFAMNFKRIRVIHQENSGLSDARNTGIDVANGKYVTFVDSDDFVHEKLLETLESHINQYNVSLSMCNYTKVNDSININKTTLNSKNKAVKIISDMEAVNMLLDDQSTCTAWGKLYAKDLFKNLRFPIGKLMEDMFVMPIIFKSAKLIAVDEQSLYFYNQEGESITRSDFNYKKLDMIEAVNFWKSNADLYYPELSEKALMHYFSTTLNTCLLLANNTDEFGVSKYLSFKREILDNYKQILNSRFVRRNNKIKVILMQLGLFKLLAKLKSTVHLIKCVILPKINTQ
jgi:glycosyltransferase involved in cell wall biosynthesis